jgi:hypothetical protein
MVRDARRTLQIVINHCPRGKNWLDWTVIIIVRSGRKAASTYVIIVT